MKSIGIKYFLLLAPAFFISSTNARGDVRWQDPITRHWYLYLPGERTSVDAEKACPLPNGCQLIGATGSYSATWLQCHRNSWPNPLNFLLKRGVNAECELSNSQVSQIASICANRSLYPSLEETILCIGTNIRRAVPRGAGSVCRHYSRCMYKVMGHLEEVRRRFLKSRYFSNSAHVWNEISTTTTTIVADVYNGIYFSCPVGR